MLYFYKSISPHPIENLHDYLDYFFSQMFAETNPSYNHEHHIHEDCQTIIEEYTVQVDNKLSAIFGAYMMLEDANKAIVKNAYSINNNIKGICDMEVEPLKYESLPELIRTPIKNLYDHLWGESKVLGYERVKDKCGTLKTHFDNFREVNESSVCPFCGIEGLLCEHDDGRDDYDHYFPKSKYPFITINFENLIPMCHNCNSKSKGQVDTPFVPETTTQRAIYYPFDTIEQHEIKLTINSATTDLSNPDNWELEITCLPIENNSKKDSWVSIFNIQKRYKAILTKESKTWKKWIIKKHRNICKKNESSYQTFYDDAIDDNEDYCNRQKGILLHAFYGFILNDPNCEANLTGNITI